MIIFAWACGDGGGRGYALVADDNNRQAQRGGEPLVRPYRPWIQPWPWVHPQIPVPPHADNNDFYIL
jgi:hypothetical protein